MNNDHAHKKEISACRLCCTRIENFSVTIGGTEILKDVSLHIHCGEITSLIGPNGAGKTTLLKAILGEIRHTGELKFLDAKGFHSGSPIIGYVPQSLAFDGSSPASVLDVFAACRGKMPVWLSHTRKIRNMAEEALRKVKADYLIDRRIGALSGGELQRFLLALALEPLPDILLLDEPVSGIDRNGLELFFDIVSALRDDYDMTIILVSHDLPLVARYSDRVVMLNRTVITSGTPQEVFSHPEAIKIFGSLKIGDISENGGGGQG